MALRTSPPHRARPPLLPTTSATPARWPTAPCPCAVLAGILGRAGPAPESAARCCDQVQHSASFLPTLGPLFLSLVALARRLTTQPTVVSAVRNHMPWHHWYNSSPLTYTPPYSAPNSVLIKWPDVCACDNANNRARGLVSGVGNCVANILANGLQLLCQ